MPRSPAADALPGRQEAGEVDGRHRLDLGAQRRERPAAQRAQHLGVAEVAAVHPAAGLDRAQLALDHPPGADEPAQGIGDDRRAEPEPRGDVVGGEGAVGAGVAGDQVAQRVGDRLEEDLGHAHRQRGTQRVAESARVLDGRPALLAGDPDPDQPAVALEVDQPGRDLLGVGALDAPVHDGLVRQRAEHPDQVGNVLPNGSDAKEARPGWSTSRATAG